MPRPRRTLAANLTSSPLSGRAGCRCSREGSGKFGPGVPSVARTNHITRPCAPELVRGASLLHVAPGSRLPRLALRPRVVATGLPRALSRPGARSAPGATPF